MAASTLVVDSRIKSLVVLLPALGVAMWIASEVASDEFIVPGLVLLLFTSLVFFTVFVQTVRFEAAILNLLLVGYLVGNRGFAELTVAKPFYPGEVCLAIVLLATLARYILSREVPDLSGSLARMILVFCGLGLARLALDYDTYRMEAIRDSAMVYYSLYFFFGRELAKRSESMAVLTKCLRFSFLALLPIAIIERYAPDLLFASGGATFLFQKDDLLTTFSAVGVFILYTHPKIYRWQWTRSLLILFYILYVVNGITRASLAALIVGSVLLFVAGRKKFFLYPMVAVALGLTVLTGLAASYGRSEMADPAIMIDKLTSMVDISGSKRYNSDYGELKAGNNEFRRTLWQSFFEETNQVAPVFGRGFGYDFIARYQNTLRLGEWQGLRSAHNFYVTLYGRMGIAGSIVFLLITWFVVKNGFKAGYAARMGWLPMTDLSFWCASWAILVAAVFGVVLEGPVGAIVFWLFLGVATQRTSIAMAEREPVDETDPDALNMHLLGPTRPGGLLDPARTRQGYGAPAAPMLPPR